MPAPLRPNDRWSMDFVADTFGVSRRLRILAINDDCCRENLCLLGDTSTSGIRVARELDTLVRLYGKPAGIVSDNGTEYRIDTTPILAFDAAGIRRGDFPADFRDAASDEIERLKQELVQRTGDQVAAEKIYEPPSCAR